MKPIQKYFLFFVNLTILASLCFGSQYSVSAQSQAQVVIEAVSPPLFPDLTWKNLGNVKKDVYVYDQILNLSGDMFKAVEIFQNEIPESVFEYYSTKNLQSLGWNSVGHSGFESTYWHSSGRYLTVQIVECPNSETDYCVNVWQSVDSSSTPPPATQLSDLSIFTATAFNKTSPANGATVPLPASTYNFLRWGDAGIGSTDRYQYCIDETNDQLCNANNWNIRNSLYSGGPGDFPLLIGHTYYWQVRVRDAGIYANNGTWWSFTVQSSGPSVVSIVRANPISSTTNASSVSFTVTFNQAVTGVNASDFVLTTSGVSGTSISGVSGSGSTYTVTVNTGVGDGTIRLDVIDDDSIKNSQNTPLGGAGANNGNFTAGQFYTIDKAPTVLSSVRAIANPVNLISLDFRVTFSEYVTGVDLNDFTLTTTGVTSASISSVGGSGTVYIVKVNTGNGNGTIRLNVSDNDSIIDSASNPLNGAYTSGQSYTINKNIESYIGGSLFGTYGLVPAHGIRDSYSGVNNGPLSLVGTGVVNVVASERVLHRGRSYSEIMGFPANQLTNNYWFPYYNNVDMDSELRVSNVGGASTTITVTYGNNIPLDSFTLVSDESISKNYAGINKGPLHVTSSASNILTSIRVLYGGFSYSELMGFPDNQLTTDYWFAYYNDVAMDSQVRVSNVGGSSTTITVTYGNNIPLDSYTLASGAVTRKKNYPGINSGPLHITSSASNILTNVRVLYLAQSYSEILGFPANQLDTEYWYPMYDNVSANSQVRVRNVGGVSTTITIYGVNNAVIDTYTLAAGGARSKNYAGINKGPLHVVSSVSNILSTQRLLYVTPTFDSFFELTGFPDSQLTTDYFFSWYNNTTMASQIRIAAP